MFTGLVEGIGRVLRLSGGRSGLSLDLELPAAIDAEARPGDSIAVEGCCLTVAGRDGAAARFDAVPETLEKTTLAALVPGSRVNLERALRLSDRVGGHLVSGHVDGTGRVRSVDPRGIEVDVVVEAPPDLMRFVVTKGSVTVAGVSLTICSVAPDAFSVALVPFTREVTTLGSIAPGDRVNLEMDLVGRWIARLLGPWGAAPPA